MMGAIRRSSGKLFSPQLGMRLVTALEAALWGPMWCLVPDAVLQRRLDRVWLFLDSDLQIGASSDQ
jgi:hypothetical protein